ncbi:MAG: hypothetical protein Q9M92_04140 [Enterobacterales bacterium]|nr:hypothetical protein [Enterobacterales bacterium]
MVQIKQNNRTYRETKETPSVAHTHYDLSPLYDDGIHRALIGLSHQTECISFSKNLSAFLPSIDTKIGGMPYVDVSDEWPRCKHDFCQQQMRFKFQTTTDLNTHNLLCFYICDRCFNNQFHSNTWTVRAYQVNSMQRYGANSHGHIDLRAFEGKVQTSYSLPAWETLSLHDHDLQSSFRMMEPSSPEALYRYFLHEHQVQVDIDQVDLIIGGYPCCESALGQQLSLNKHHRFVAQLNNCSILFGNDFCQANQSLIIFCRNSKIEISLSQKP